MTPKKIAPPTPIDPPYAEPADAEPAVESRADAVRHALGRIGPWMVSLVAHLAVIVLALLLVKAVILHREPAPRPVSIRQVTHRATEPLDPTRGIELDPIRRTPQTPAPEPDPSPAVVLPSEPKALATIGPGAPRPAKNLLDWVSTDGGGSIFVAPTGPAGDITAHRIVFVIDASGSLIGDLGFVVEELKKTVGDLSPQQKFSVIFFQRGYALESPPAGLKPATDEAKRAAMDWFTLESGHITPGGGSNPMRALRLAFSYKPDLVYLLSDNITGSGRYELDRGALLGEIRSLNAEAKATIHTIQFIYDDPDATLSAIAQEHGGIHRRVSEQVVRHGSGP